MTTVVTVFIIVPGRYATNTYSTVRYWHNLFYARNNMHIFMSYFVRVSVTVVLLVQLTSRKWNI